MIERLESITVSRPVTDVGDFSNGASVGIWNMCARKVDGALWTCRDGISVNLVDLQNVFRSICDGKVSGK